MDTATDIVRERAYLIWETEGRPDGRDLEHWLQAERELSLVSSPPAADKKTRRNGTTPKARTASSRARKITR